MLQLKRAIGAYLLISALSPTLAAQAAIYYVATTGSNSHPGTEKKPWRTVSYATSQMVAGDTTYVMGGTYVEGLIRFLRSGTQAAPIKLLNYPGESPVIDCNYVGTNMVLIQHASGGANSMGWITIEGLEIKRCWHGIRAYNLHDSVIRRNWVHDSTYNGLLMSGTRVLIDRNRLNGNGLTDPTPPGGHGIYMNGSSNIVTNNVIYNNRCFGIQLNGTVSYSATAHPAPEFALSNDWIITNNTFAYQKGCAGMVIWGPRANNTRIENNIFYENNVDAATTSTQGVSWAKCCSTGVQIRNNLFYGSGSGGTLFIGSAPTEGIYYTQSGNIVNTDNPRFVNAPANLPPSPNFALSERSPAIDKGLPPSDETLSKTFPTAFDEALFKALRIDFAATARPKGQAYDIGAYEYNPDGDSQAPVQVQNVQIH